MDDGAAGKLQICSVEERESAAATCIIRCVGGVPRTGQQFAAESASDSADTASPFTLDWINRYERMMDFIDPPHTAKVHLTGEAVAVLERGVILTSVASDEH
ncbi:hypothetical protein OQI_00250 [Streptomyces pharetrae CZA14]|uniref:Uncharacterized protein n=1 Tax=Streptomyces pharetrae CZA14 TaxID=1144883 RepID=A0ABX3YR02_9ACTN|nr:hypothetical protein OQI_00250 [Streptomyces pharetrae CZA14]